ncbi:cytochrome P450 [Marasmius fiardii PR-910]|nr:cytochrome P450 [Marasmius fiardii PR-910]
MESFSSRTVGFLTASFFLLFVVQKVINMRRLYAEVGYHPGPRMLLSQKSIIANLLPRIPWVTPGWNHMFRNKFSKFEYYGWDIFAHISVFPEHINLNVANAAAVKELITWRARFPKPVDDYESLAVFGKNIVVTEGETWKKYRKIVSPAFSDKNHKLVWDETVQIMVDLFDSVWQNQDVVNVDHSVELTLPITLFVIGVAGFGRRISWHDDLILPPGHKLTFKEALSEVSKTIFVRVVCPERLMGISEKTRKVKLAFEELDQYMLEMIKARRIAEKKEERYDLFSSLMDANDSPDFGEIPLTEREVVGNIFIFLLAGHETTAHTLAYTLGLLALYQEEQEILYQHIQSVIPDGRPPTYEEMPLLTQSMAVIYETLRLFPPVNLIPKVSAEDTTLVSENAAGETKVIPVPRGTSIAISVIGLHYNPRYWKDPYEFRPSRFRGDWPKDAFLPFSGVRACIGRKFSETEGTAILTMFIKKYKVTLKEEPQFAGETMEQKRARIFASRPGITIAPIRMPLVFTRRT